MQKKLNGKWFKFQGSLMSRLYIVAMAILVGVLIGMQINSASNTTRELSYPIRKITNQINQEKYQIKHLKKEIFKSEREKRKLEHDKSGGSESYLELRQDLRHLKMISGETKISGEGVVLFVDSGKDENIALKIENKKIFLLLINELRLNGVEAISINGQRITNLSGITLAGTHLDINNTEIGPAYEVKMIGNSNELYQFLNKKSVSVMFMRKVYQFHVSLKKSSFIEMPQTRIPKPISQIISE